MSQFQQRKSKKRRCRAWDSNTGRKVGTCSLSYGGYHQCCSYLNVLSNLSLSFFLSFFLSFSLSAYLLLMQIIVG